MCLLIYTYILNQSSRKDKVSTFVANGNSLLLLNIHRNFEVTHAKLRKATQTSLFNNLGNECNVNCLDVQHSFSTEAYTLLEPTLITA